MADLKISQLTPATTPLSGAEEVPLVQGGVTVKATVNDYISGFDSALNLKEDKANKGVANGYAPLNGSALIDSVYLPSYVDDVIEVANFGSLPVTGETGKLYVTLDTNQVYRWTGSVYVEVSSGVTAHSQLSLDDGTNPHGTTKTDVGLSNVTNNAQWNKTGNSGTNPATDKLGTIDAQDLNIVVNNKALLRLFQSVGNWIYVGSTINRTKLSIIATATDANGEYLTLGETTNPNLRIGVATNHGWIQTYGTVPLALNPLGSNVGIGTTSPTKKIDVNGEARIRTLPTGLTTENILVVNGSGDVRAVSPNARFKDKEIPTGLINGSNVTFTLANTPVSGSEHVYRNGLLQESGAGNDYTISGATITFLTAPLTGDKIRVTYRI